MNPEYIDLKSVKREPMYGVRRRLQFGEPFTKGCVVTVIIHFPLARYARRPDQPGQYHVRTLIQILSDRATERDEWALICRGAADYLVQWRKKYIPYQSERLF